MSDKAPKKPKVIREEVKDRHTSHWDLDYVSRADLEELMSRPKAPQAEGDDRSEERELKDKASVSKTEESRSDKN